jgi:hypothetical protein
VHSCKEAGFAALLLTIVVGSFSTSSVTIIKLIGVAMIVALILDATLVRVLLVPATMRLIGPASWWAPGPLRQFYARYCIHEDNGPASGAPPRVVSAQAAPPPAQLGPPGLAVLRGLNGREDRPCLGSSCGAWLVCRFAWPSLPRAILLTVPATLSRLSDV